MKSIQENSQKQLTDQEKNMNTLPIDFVSKIEKFQILAKNAHKSGLYNSMSESALFMVLMAADELGIPPMAALNGGIWNIKGKIEISARMMNSMMRKQGIKIKIKRCDNQGCELHGFRPDSGDECEVSYTEEDAKRNGSYGKDNYKKNPADMYFARAISILGRRLCPDIIGTAYIEGEIIEAKVQKIEQFPLLEEKEETETEEEIKLHVSEFLLQNFTDENMDDIFDDSVNYIKAYASHNKKNVKKSLETYVDNNKFLSHMNKWKEKQKKQIEIA